MKDENADGLYDRLDPALGFGIIQILRGDGVTTINWAAVPGRTYQLESCDALGRPWVPRNAPLSAAPWQLTSRLRT
ncbi:MAG: hypothetical protein M3Q86_01610 [Verrucomicrobiota bacterium]|nr:hypothetical protein [Verrucomicrobiota bacterium]